MYAYISACLALLLLTAGAEANLEFSEDLCPDAYVPSSASSCSAPGPCKKSLAPACIVRSLATKSLSDGCCCCIDEPLQGVQTPPLQGVQSPSTDLRPPTAAPANPTIVKPPIAADAPGASPPDFYALYPLAPGEAPAPLPFNQSAGLGDSEGFVLGTPYEFPDNLVIRAANSLANTSRTTPCQRPIGQAFVPSLGYGAAVPVCLEVQRRVPISAPIQGRRLKGDLQTQQTSRRLQQGSYSCPIEVKLRVFIPTEVVFAPLQYNLENLPNPIPKRAFNGNGRSFSYSGGTSKAELTATFTARPQDFSEIENIGPGDGDFDETIEYGLDSVTSPKGASWWVGKFTTANPTILQSTKLPRSATNLYLSGSLSGSRGSIRFHVEGANPLVAVAPAISADIDLTFIYDSAESGVSFTISGSHDGFPAYELYINQEVVYTYDPQSAGNSPLALSGLIGEQKPFIAGNLGSCPGINKPPSSTSGPGIGGTPSISGGSLGVGDDISTVEFCLPASLSFNSDSLERQNGVPLFPTCATLSGGGRSGGGGESGGWRRKQLQVVTINNRVYQPDQIVDEGNTRVLTYYLGVNLYCLNAFRSPGGTTFQVGPLIDNPGLSELIQLLEGRCPSTKMQDPLWRALGQNIAGANGEATGYLLQEDKDYIKSLPYC